MSLGQSGHVYQSVVAGGHARLHLGDVHYHNVQNYLDQGQTPKSFGLCLGEAPQIEPDAFKGRQHELIQLRKWLTPGDGSPALRIVSIVGMGGIGKTQLSIAHARNCAKEYSSVFWVNAKDQPSLRQSLMLVSSIVFPRPNHENVSGTNEEDNAIERLRRWLSEPKNDRWLLIYDNYDDPNIPGIQSSTGYDIRPFFPVCSQGNILITTRSTKLAFSKQLTLKPIDIPTSVAILSQRSSYIISKDDAAAARLALRLGGLPLALAAAGTYIGLTHLSCDEYHDLYESMWTELFGSDAEELFEYEARTLSSTWMMSMRNIEKQDADTAELLSFLALLSPHDIWFELVQAGATGTLPWMTRITKSTVHFQRAMTKLRNHSLLDMHDRSYQLHPCFHDWLVHKLNPCPSEAAFTAATLCISNSLPSRFEASYYKIGQRLIGHVNQLQSERFKDVWGACVFESEFYNAVDKISQLQLDLFQTAQSLSTCKWALIGKKATLGQNHPSTLATAARLGHIYGREGMTDRAEQTLKETLAGCVTILGPDHIDTLHTCFDLGTFYLQSGREQTGLSEAEHFYLQALSGFERTLGPDDFCTLRTVGQLGIVYHQQGNLLNAEQMQVKAIAGLEKLEGFEGDTLSRTYGELGELYADCGKVEQGEKLLKRAVDGLGKTWQFNGVYETILVCKLADLYISQSKFSEAEKLYSEAIDLCRSTFSFPNPTTRQVRNYLRLLSNSMRGDNTNLSISLLRLVSVIELANEYGKEDPTILNRLGKALVFRNESDNARIAFGYSIITFEKGIPIFSGIACDGCNLMTALSTGRYLCSQCDDIDLCDLCMDRYGSNAFLVPGCLNHSFFRIDGAKNLSTSQSTRKVGGAEWTVWINSMIEQYTNAANMVSVAANEPEIG